MATKKKTPPVTETVSAPQLYALADESIGMIREILQLTLYTAILILEKFDPIKIDSDVFNCHYRCLCNGQNYHLFIHENNIDYFFARLE